MRLDSDVVPADAVRPTTSASGLSGHVVIITGSSRGIGAATARVVSAHGATVVLHGRAPSPELTALASELGARSITCDVADAQAVQSAVRGVLETERQVHALINCAGHVHPKPFLDSDDEDWMLEFRERERGRARLHPHENQRNVARIRLGTGAKFAHRPDRRTRGDRPCPRS